MALIKCTECGGLISDKASACPHCGCPVNSIQDESIDDNEKEEQVIYDEDEYEDGNNKEKWLYAIVCLLVLALLGIGYWAWHSGLLGTKNDKVEVSEVKKDGSSTVSDSQPITLEGTHNFNGSIGPANVEMSIIIDGSDVNGYYHYNSQERGYNMTLQGNMGSDGVMNLTEYAPDGTNSGRWEGIFNGTSLEGSYINMINGKQYKINLSKTNSLSKLSPVTKEMKDEIVLNLSQLKEKVNEKPHFPDWLLGAWKIDMYDDYGNSLGTMYSVINHGTCKTYADGKLVLEQKFDIDNRTMKFEKGGYYLLNLDEEKLFGADGQEWIKISDNTSYIPSSSSSTNSYNSQHSNDVSSKREPFSFSTAYDVMRYVSHNVFTNGRRELRFRSDGIYINHFHASKGAPYVVKFSPNYALIRVEAVDGSDWDFYIYPEKHRIIDDGGNIYELK